LEMILLKQKAMKESLDERKVISIVDRQPIDPNKPIMGGQQSGMFDNIFNKMQKERKGLTSIGEDLPPLGSRGGKDDIASPMIPLVECLDCARKKVIVGWYFTHLNDSGNTSKISKNTAINITEDGIHDYLSIIYCAILSALGVVLSQWLANPAVRSSRPREKTGLLDFTVR